jgi:hypothetical protein
MKDCLKNSPWETEDELKKELEEAWERIKGRGLKEGVLVRHADGSLRGKGNPRRLFDLKD